MNHKFKAGDKVRQTKPHTYSEIRDFEGEIVYIYNGSEWPYVVRIKGYTYCYAESELDLVGEYQLELAL